jgi:hypothetical protein
MTWEQAVDAARSQKKDIRYINAVADTYYQSTRGPLQRSGWFYRASWTRLETLETGTAGQTGLRQSETASGPAQARNADARIARQGKIRPQ